MWDPGRIKTGRGFGTELTNLQQADLLARSANGHIETDIVCEAELLDINHALSICSSQQSATGSQNQPHFLIVQNESSAQEMDVVLVDDEVMNAMLTLDMSAHTEQSVMLRAA